jgi:hypothetical protein
MTGTRRVLVTLVGVMVAVVAACTPPTGGGGTSTTTTAPTTTVPSTWTSGACPGASGVTVVVDFSSLRDEVVVRCALGAQSSGLVALANIGLAAVGEPGVAPVCQIRGLPSEGFPFCWFTGGYWSYWAAPSRGAPWQFATTGPGAGPVPQGSVQGWAWAPGFVSDGPSVGSDGSPLGG